jgi:hypothetical protein
MPRMQERLFIDKATGDATLSREILPDADFGQRIAGLKATIPMGVDTADPETVRHVMLRCDGCGMVAELDWDDPRKPGGWTERDSGDYCPACGRLPLCAPALAATGPLPRWTCACMTTGTAGCASAVRRRGTGG